MPLLRHEIPTPKLPCLVETSLTQQLATYQCHSFGWCSINLQCLNIESAIARGSQKLKRLHSVESKTYLVEELF